MSGRLLDTNVVINFMKKINSAKTVMMQTENNCCVCAVTVGELMFGAKKSRLSDFNKNKYMAFCDFVGVQEIDFDVARVYGDVKNQLQSDGKLIPENDMWISSVAIAKDLTLVSYDRHFQNVKNLNFIFVEL